MYKYTSRQLSLFEEPIKTENPKPSKQKVSSLKVKEIAMQFITLDVLAPIKLSPNTDLKILTANTRKWMNKRFKDESSLAFQEIASNLVEIIIDELFENLNDLESTEAMEQTIFEAYSLLDKENPYTVYIRELIEMKDFAQYYE